MKALTIWQPWASLIMAGAKPVEWRGWPCPRWIVGQRIAIHAGARPARPAEIADIIARIDDTEFEPPIPARGAQGFWDWDALT
jgi:hypothetical protein